MISIFRKPVVIGLLFFLVLGALCFFLSIPMYNGMATYEQGLVHFEIPNKLSLAHIFGVRLNELQVNGITPKHVELTTMGYTMLILVNVGMPFLLALRFYFAKQKAELDDAE